MPRILITGAAGFIGSNLLKRLLSQDNQIVCIDNYITGRRENIPDGLPNVTMIEDDICKVELVENDFDIVYHLASPASPRDYLKHSIETIETGTQGVFNALEIARKSGAKFVFTSSSEIYGETDTYPQSESRTGGIPTTGPRAVYSEAKRMAEVIVCEYNRKHNLNTMILRLFNTYGPGMYPDDGRVISNFVAQSFAKKPLTINGDGSQTRSFCYIDDVIDAILALSEVKYHKPINIGNSQEIRVIDLASMIHQTINPFGDIRFDYLPKSDEDVLRRCPDTSLAQSLTKWSARTSLEMGLKKYIEWFSGLSCCP